MEDADRGARSHAADRVSGRVQRSRVRACGLVGGDPRDRPKVSVLYVPRQRHGASRSRRIASVEDLHGGSAEAHGHDTRRDCTLGPSGAGIWATPTVDARRGVLYVATGDNYSHPAHQHERRNRCPQREYRSHRLVAANDAQRCLQLRVRPQGGELPERTAAPTTTTGRLRCSSGRGLVGRCSWPGRSRASCTGSIQT